MLLRQTLMYLPAQVIGPLSQVVAAVAWTYWLAPGPYGLLTFLIASQDLVFLVGLSWWTHYTMRYLGGLDADRRAAFQASEAPIFVLAVLLQAVGTLIVIGLLHETVSSRLVLAAVAYVATRSLLVHLGERARSQGHIGIYTVAQAGGLLGGFVLALVAVSQIDASPEAALLGFTLAQMVTIAVLWRLLGIARGQWLPHRAVMSAALAYGLPLVVAGGLSWVGQNGIRVVVEHVAGLDALGLIAVGWGLGQRLAATLAMVVITASFPLAVQSLHEGTRRDAYSHLSNGGLMLIGLIVPASIGLALLADPFTTTFIAAPFRATTIAILPFAAAAGAVRNIRMHTADPVFLLIERPRINTLINIIDVVAVLAGCLIGLKGFGLTGAVVGCLAGTTVGTLAGFGLAGILGGFILPIADLLRIGAAALAMTLGLVLMPWSHAVPSVSARLLIEPILGAAIYAAVLAAFYPSLPRRLLAILRRDVVKA